MKRIRPYHGAGMLFYHRDPHENVHILLGRRISRPGLGKWSVPGGGYESDDGIMMGRRDYRSTAIRETSEEIARSVTDCSLIWRLHLPGFHWELFSTESEDMNIPNYNCEFSQMSWFPIAELPSDTLFLIKNQVASLRRSLHS